MKIDEKELIKRLSNRRCCSECGKIYNLKFTPPKLNMICDNCNGNLYIRNDDKNKTIKHRLDVYNKETKPLITFYQNLGLVAHIDSKGTINKIHNKITNVINDSFK